jgi:hypothetical protein
MEERAEASRDALGHLARVDEDDGRTVSAHEGGNALVNFLPHFVGANGGERRRRYFDGEIDVAQVPRVDERTGAIGPHQETGDVFERLLRRRKPDALQT